MKPNALLHGVIVVMMDACRMAGSGSLGIIVSLTHTALRIGLSRRLLLFVQGCGCGQVKLGIDFLLDTGWVRTARSVRSEKPSISISTGTVTHVSPDLVVWWRGNVIMFTDMAMTSECISLGCLLLQARILQSQSRAHSSWHWHAF